MFSIWTMFNESINSKKTTKLIPLLQLDHRFVDKMNQIVTKYRTGIRMKEWWWFQFAWVVDIVLHNERLPYRINRDEGDVVNATLLKYSKEGRSSSSHIKNRNVPLGVCYDDTKTLPGAIWKTRQVWRVQKNRNSRCPCVKCKVNQALRRLFLI